jgi:hypothetical protein
LYTGTILMNFYTSSLWGYRVKYPKIDISPEVLAFSSLKHFCISFMHNIHWSFKGRSTLGSLRKSQSGTDVWLSFRGKSCRGLFARCPPNWQGFFLKSPISVLTELGLTRRRTLSAVFVPFVMGITGLTIYSFKWHDLSSLVPDCRSSV